MEMAMDFTCRICGVECDTAPDPPERAICPKCCEDHDYRYDSSMREHRCIHCDEPRPWDWSIDGWHSHTRRRRHTEAPLR